MTVIKRDKISEGKMFKVKDLVTGIYKNGTPFWNFKFSFYDNNGFSKIYYRTITLMSRGERCEVKEGDWVVFERFEEFICKREYNKDGGITLYDTFVGKFRKLTKENKNEK